MTQSADTATAPLQALACITRDTLQDVGITHAQAGLALVDSAGDTVIKPYILKRPDIGSLTSTCAALPDGVTVYDSAQPVEQFSTDSTTYNTHQPLPASHHAQLLTDSWKTFNAHAPRASAASNVHAAFDSLYAELLRETVTGTKLHYGHNCDKTDEGGVYKHAEVLDLRRAARASASPLTWGEWAMSWLTMAGQPTEDAVTHTGVLGAFRDFLIAQSQAETSSCAVLLAKMDESLRDKYNASLKDQTTGKILAEDIVARTCTTEERESVVSKATEDVATMKAQWGEYASKWAALNGTAEVPTTFHQYFRASRQRG